MWLTIPGSKWVTIDRTDTTWKALSLDSVFPTRVGMDRRGTAARALAGGIPHTRGDGPYRGKLAIHSAKYSPHAWGWTASTRWSWARGSVFPTRVGMDRLPTDHWLSRFGIPHTRGDGPDRSWTVTGLSSYSPHAWGWTEVTDLADSFDDQILLQTTLPSANLDGVFTFKTSSK